MTKTLKAFCCWSGGKESALSFYKAKKSGVNTFYLLNMISEDGKHSRSHGVNSALLKLQSEAIGIPVMQRETSWENYEEEFKKAILGLKKKDIRVGVFGDIDLQEHRDWVERVCKEMGIQPILPLWKEKRQGLLEEFIQVGFKAIVVATNSDSLGQEWLCRRIDNKFIEDLSALGNVDLCGEKGEYHTFVFDGPIFKRPIEFVIGKKILKDKPRSCAQGRGKHWFLEILPK